MTAEAHLERVARAQARVRAAFLRHRRAFWRRDREAMAATQREVAAAVGRLREVEAEAGGHWLIERKAGWRSN